MIQHPEGTDRGVFLFSKYPEAITALVKSRKANYFDSMNYNSLRQRVRLIDAHIDNEAPAVTSLVSDITPPVIRRSYHEYSALFTKFLETDPLFSPRRTNGVDAAKEQAIQAVMCDNLEKSYFRERCLPWTIDHIIRYGTAGTYSCVVDGKGTNSLMTVKADDYTEQVSQVYGESESTVVGIPIHPCNMIVDPRSNFMVAPDYLGFLGDICVANLAALDGSEWYIGENLKEVIEIAKRGLPDKDWFSGRTAEARDFSKGHTAITYLWTRLPFEGNETDPLWYTVEMVADKVIRIHENPLDKGTTPVAIQRIMPRQYDWVGNSPLEDKICVQNAQYFMVNTMTEVVARSLDRIVFYNEGELDVEAINSRHQAAGFVPVKGVGASNLEKLVYSPPMPFNGFQQADWLMQELRREDQDTNSMPNFNPQAQGGPTNSTLGGAQMMASIGELKTGYFISQLAVGLKDVAKQQLELIKNMAQEQIQTSGGKSVAKADIIGDVSFTVKISNVFNYQRESQDSINRLTMLINWKATQLPQFAAIKMSQFIEDVVRNGTKRENIDDYVDLELLRMVEKQQMDQLKKPPAPTAPPGPPPKQGPVPSIGISMAVKDMPPNVQDAVYQLAGLNVAGGATPPVPMTGTPLPPPPPGGPAMPPPAPPKPPKPMPAGPQPPQGGM